MRRPGLSCLAAVAFWGWGVMAVAAAPQALPAPAGDVVLTVSGAIAVENAPGLAQFDLAMLEQLGVETLRTTTIWTDGEQEFRGVPLHRLLDRLGVTHGRLEARAINDYAAEVPVSDAVEGGPIIAWMRNGASMTVRDKGPLWIIYPYDARRDYRTEIHYSRSVWQLEQIDVRP
jgi:hypothetical protein